MTFHEERAWLDESGISYEVLVEDLERFYVNVFRCPAMGLEPIAATETSEEFETPENFRRDRWADFLLIKNFWIILMPWH